MIVLVEACEYEVVIHFLRTSDFVLDDLPNL